MNTERKIQWHFESPSAERKKKKAALPNGATESKQVIAMMNFRYLSKGMFIGHVISQKQMYVHFTSIKQVRVKAQPDKSLDL